MNQRNSVQAIKAYLTMAPALLPLVPSFLAVASLKSFAAAARNSGVSPSAMSQAISRLERELGVDLFVRTTRSVNLTEAGLELFDACHPALTRIAESLSAATRPRRELGGTLRLNVPRVASTAILPSLLAAFHERHPHVAVDVVVDDRNVNIVAEGFDAGVRAHQEIEKDMVAVRLSAPFRFLTVGSPEYLARRGVPKHPKDLVDHLCLPWRFPSTGAVWRWEFQEKRRRFQVSVKGPVSSTDGEFLVSCAKAGLGLTYACEPEVAEDLKRGTLLAALETYSIELAGLFLYYPKSSHQDPKLAAFVECTKERARELPRVSAQV